MRSWPAEWAPHVGCILLYPHNPGTFRVELARKQVRDLVQSVAQIGQEHVYLFCHNDTTAEIVRRQLLLDNDASHDDDDDEEEQEQERRRKKIHVLVCPSNDTWARDTAPTFVIDDENNINKKKLLGLDWDFNAYGGKTGGGCYWPCTQDQAIAKHICQSLQQQQDVSHKLPMISHLHVPLVLEGGSIHTDGAGTILTTKECLLNPNRNPKLSQYEVEQYLLESTGCSKVIWLEHGLAFDDDTNGHIDNFACFVAPTKLVLAWTDHDENDPDNYRRCRAAQKLLQSSTDAQGRALHITKLYLPKPMYYTQSDLDSLRFGKYGDTHVFPRIVGERMAASYVNFYISNHAILVPQFGGDAKSADSNALATLRSVFSSLETDDNTTTTTTTTQRTAKQTVVGIPSREILLGGGNIHCITQQIPSL